MLNQFQGDLARKTHDTRRPKLNKWGQCKHDFSKNGFVTPNMSPGLGGNLFTSWEESLSCIVKYGRISPPNGILKPGSQLLQQVSQKKKKGPTGRKRSRIHHIAWLVWAAEAPKTRIGSQRTRHSQIDHRFVRTLSNNNNGGGINGAVVARIYPERQRQINGYGISLTWITGSYTRLNEVSVICCTSIECGISTWRTDPRKPSSTKQPGSGSGLIFILWAPDWSREVGNDDYHFAMLWQAASSIGVPWASNRGPKWLTMQENKDGYWCFVNMTTDRWEKWKQELRIKSNPYLLVSPLWHRILPLDEIRETIDEAIFGKRLILAIDGYTRLFAYAERMGLNPLVKLHRVRECTKCTVTRLEISQTENWYTGDTVFLFRQDPMSTVDVTRQRWGQYRCQIQLEPV